MSNSSRTASSTIAPPTTPNTTQAITLIRRVFAIAFASVLMLGPAAYADGNNISSNSRYELDAKKEIVRAAITVTVSNNQPSVRQGNYIRFYYLSSFNMLIPADAQDLVVTSNGAPLSVTRERSGDPSTDFANIRFPSNLLYRQSRTLDIRFNLKGEKPRSKDQTRVGPGYATFTVFSPGQAGQNTVEVVLPKSMTFDSTSDEFSSEKSDDTVTYTSTTTNTDNGFWAVISARDPEIAAHSTVEIGQQQVDVLAYEDDPQWLKFVSSRMSKSVPVLEELLGTPWPGGLSQVREDSSVNVRGYDGWFDSYVDEIVIGEDLDAETLYHELTHAWATTSGLGARWISEGIAQELAAQTITELGGTPRKLIAVTPQGKHAIPLSTWNDDLGRALPADAYGYPASYAAIKALLEGSDEGTQSAVLAATLEGTSAFSTGTDELTSSRSGWQKFLDIVEVVGGNDKAPAIFEKWILTKETSLTLVPRREALEAYHSIDDADGDFVPPLGLRRAMTEWEFAPALKAVEQLEPVGVQAVALQDAAARNDMEIPEPVVAIYQDAQTAEDYAALPANLTKATTAVEAVGASTRAANAKRNPLAALGAQLLDLDNKADEAQSLLAKADLDGATTAANDASKAARWITWVGLAAVLGGLLLLAGLVFIGRRLVRRSRRRREERAEESAPAGLVELDAEAPVEPVVEAVVDPLGEAPEEAPTEPDHQEPHSGEDPRD